MNLSDYVTLGRSGLRVSPLCLGTMTFGTEWGWGADENTSQAILDRYLDAGGNFIDTANRYTNGQSESLLGKFLGRDGLRDRIVLATKFTMGMREGDPNAAGNGRKNIYQALEASLRRLQTDYVDLYWLHMWDRVTPVEEVVDTLTDLTRQGKIRYYGFSDVPAWYAARAQTLAEQQGKNRAVALQLEYSLAERSIEREHIPAAQELGMAICPWSPLKMGFLTGKYRRTGNEMTGEGRLESMKAHPVFGNFSDKQWTLLDTLLEASSQLGRTPAEIALAWVARQPGITSTIIGTTRIDQLEKNLASIEISIPAEIQRRLDSVSSLEPIHPYLMYGEVMRSIPGAYVTARPWIPLHLTGASNPPESESSESRETLERAA